MYITNSEKKHVVVITDCKDVAYNEMKWVILKECAKMGFFNVDVELVAVEEFSIINAAFLTKLTAECCPQGTVLSLVINPQKIRSARIYGELPSGIKYFGANTGALTWLLEEADIQEIYEIPDPGFVTFGGKYVHAPNVAKLVAGIPLSEFGIPFQRESLKDLEIIDGTILHIDNFGLMKIKGKPLSYGEGQKIQIFKNSEYVLDAIFTNRMMSLGDKEWVLYPGSSFNALPELGLVRNKEGYKEIGAKIGDIITWKIIN